MKDLPILVSGPLIQPILDDIKTETRRLRGLKEINTSPNEWNYTGCDIVSPFHLAPRFLGRFCAFFYTKNSLDQTILKVVPSPYGRPGDRLWVREAWTGRLSLRKSDPIRGEPIRYRADYDRPEWSGIWRPSIHMPRWASRITLEVVNIRVERLQDISEEDALAEGVTPIRVGHWADPRAGTVTVGGRDSYIEGFGELWESINGSGSWAENPWVWVVKFRRIK